jgi:hypothetical protein
MDFPAGGCAIVVRGLAAKSCKVQFESAAWPPDKAAMHNLFRILFWLALVFAVTMALLPHPPALPVESNDKVQHMTAFATLAVLGLLAYPQVSRLRIALGLVAVGAGIEVLQMIPQLHRDAEWADLAADSAAILAMLALAGLVLRRRPAR